MRGGAERRACSFLTNVSPQRGARRRSFFAAACHDISSSYCTVALRPPSRPMVLTLALSLGLAGRVRLRRVPHGGACAGGASVGRRRRGYSQSSRLRGEVEAPFAKVRLFVWPALMAGAAIATYFAGTRSSPRRSARASRRPTRRQPRVTSPRHGHQHRVAARPERATRGSPAERGRGDGGARVGSAATPPACSARRPPRRPQAARRVVIVAAPEAYSPIRSAPPRQRRRRSPPPTCSSCCSRWPPASPRKPPATCSAGAASRCRRAAAGTTSSAPAGDGRRAECRRRGARLHAHPQEEWARRHASPGHAVVGRPRAGRRRAPRRRPRHRQHLDADALSVLLYWHVLSVVSNLFLSRNSPPIRRRLQPQRGGRRTRAGVGRRRLEWHVHGERRAVDVGAVDRDGNR